MYELTYRTLHLLIYSLEFPENDNVAIGLIIHGSTGHSSEDPNPGTRVLDLVP